MADKMVLIIPNGGETLLILNAIICGMIALRLMLFKRNGATHRPWGRWLAYILIVFYGSYPIRTLLGEYVPVDWMQVFINAVICGAVVKTGGNIVQIFKVSR
ncbi:phage holin family protein [Sodalis sp. C49]|uniref:phage holin family protein n=1 Tax=Sodalis sp. C49 TaxID=3228929 RepID=UPI003965CE68